MDHVGFLYRRITHLNIYCSSLQIHVMKGTSFVMMMSCVGRRVKACTRLPEAATALDTRDHARGTSRASTPFNSHDSHTLLAFEEISEEIRLLLCLCLQTLPVSSSPLM